MTLDQYIAELIEFRDKHTAGDNPVVQTVIDIETGNDINREPQEPSLSCTSGKKTVYL